MPPTLTTDTARQWLSFLVDDEEFGIDLLQVQEIRSYESPMRIANGPACFNGVLELRGEVIPVIGLRPSRTTPAVPAMDGGLVNDCLLAVGELEERSLLLIDADKLLAAATAALPDCAAN